MITLKFVVSGLLRFVLCPGNSGRVVENEEMYLEK